jgi:transcriptional regulator with XRE-family HTH domain
MEPEARLAELVADRFAELRRERGWSLEELATRAGMHRTSLGLVERHKRLLTLESASRLAQALDTPLSGIVAQAEGSC